MSKKQAAKPVKPMAKKQPASQVIAVVPHLCVRNAAKAIDFYKAAFGAKERNRMFGPDSKSIMHAEMRLGDAFFYLIDEFPEHGAVSPLGRGGTSVTIHLSVRSADAVFKKAVAAGARVIMPLADQFWGDRYGTLEDPFGHRWSIAARLEDLTPQQMKSRSKKFNADNPDWPKKMQA